MGFKSPEKQRSVEEKMERQFRETANRVLADLKESMRQNEMRLRAEKFLKDHPRK